MMGEVDLCFLSSVHPRHGDNHRKSGRRPAQGPEHNGQSERVDVQVTAF